MDDTGSFGLPLTGLASETIPDRPDLAFCFELGQQVLTIVCPNRIHHSTVLGRHGRFVDWFYSW